MQVHQKFFGAWVFASAILLLCSIPSNAQTGSNAITKENTRVLTKEALFEGAGLSAESQNKVLGNLLKYSQSTKAKEDGHFEMKVPAFSPRMPYMMANIIPAFPESNPCASVADEKQLKAMHSLLMATLSSKSINTAAFDAEVPKGCNAKRLRYYLNVTAQLFPDKSTK